MATVSKSIKMFREMQRIQILEGDIWGHRKNLNEYYSKRILHHSSSVIERIEEIELEGGNKLEGKTTEDIETKVSEKITLRPEMVAYILINKLLPEFE
jgi:hypothetical protein